MSGWMLLIALLVLLGPVVIWRADRIGAYVWRSSTGRAWERSGFTEQHVVLWTRVVGVVFTAAGALVIMSELAV